MLIVVVDYTEDGVRSITCGDIQPCQLLSSKIGSIPPNRSNRGTFRILIDAWILAEVLGSAAKGESRSTRTGLAEAAGSGGLEMALKYDYSILPLTT